MSFIPPIRDRDKRNFPFTKDPSEKNEYWQGYMNDDGVNQMIDFDYVTQVASFFFDNLGNYEQLTDIGEEKAQILQDCFMEWMESERNEFGVDIMDGMNEDEYNDIVEAVEAGYRHNYCTDLKNVEDDGNEDQLESTH